MRLHNFFIVFTVCFIAFLSCSNKEENSNDETTTEVKTYKNPILKSTMADPSVIKADDGYFYAYSGEKVIRSRNLTGWLSVGDAFTDDTRPTWVDDGGVWASDVNYFNGHYVMYYAMSVWGGEWNCGIGVAVSSSPSGPFSGENSPLFRSSSIGVQNSIDPCYFEDNGKKYLIWGSFNGIYCIELSDDGLSLKTGATKVQIAGTATEGSYVYKRGDYYYLFGSIGTCCNGLNSTYTTVVGRSTSLLGPYVDKDGESMMDNHYEVLIHGNDKFVGTGHDSEIITDDNGNDWMLYHAWLTSDSDLGRVLMMDQIHWENDWPVVTGQEPSDEADAPVFE